MGSDRFWHRWWTLLSRQWAVWVFALIAQGPTVVLMLLFAPLLLLLPSLDAPPEAWQAWFEQQGAVLLGVSVAAIVFAAVLGLAAWLLGVWAEAGIFTLVRRVWGREATPLTWAEARRDLWGPFGRALVVQLAYGVAAFFLFIAWFALIIGTLVASSDADTPGPFFAVLFGSLCVAFPLIFLVAPWLMTWRVAAVMEYPASWRATWQNFVAVGRRGWLGLYGMLILHVAVNIALGVVIQVVNVPWQLLTAVLSDVGNVIQSVGLVVNAVLRSGVQVVVTALISTGWAVLYWHYRLDEEDTTPDEVAPVAPHDDAGLEAQPVLPADATEAPAAQPSPDAPPETDTA